MAVSFPASPESWLKPGEGKGSLLALQPDPSTPRMCVEVVPEGAPVLLQS